MTGRERELENERQEERERKDQRMRQKMRDRERNRQCHYPAFIQHHATCTHTDMDNYEFHHIQKKYSLNKYDNYPQKILSAIITRKLCDKLQYETLKELIVHAVRCGKE